MGIEKCADVIMKIAENASKEYSIERTLDKMLAEWEHIDMELTGYKDTGTYIVKVADEIVQMIDDHMVMAQQLSFSPFKGAFEEAIDEFDKKLRLISDVIEEWIDVQKYLRFNGFYSYFF